LRKLSQFLAGTLTTWCSEAYFCDVSKILIRSAKKEDAKGILEAQYSAIHETASKDYSPEVISAWSTPVTSERIQKYLSDSFPNETTVVAEINGEFAGFGSIVEIDNELRAIYVGAKFGGRGVGTAILNELEKIAISKGCTKLQMVSSLTAVPFYRSHGYCEEARGTHTLRSGITMASVTMFKALE
jgi:putative acetyltransferase